MFYGEAEEVTVTGVHPRRGLLGDIDYNVRQASAIQEPTEEMLYNRSKVGGFETGLKGMFVIGAAPIILIAALEAAPVAIGALQTAGAASTTSVGLAGGGSGASVLTMGGSSGTIGAGGLSSGATWTGIAEAAEGAYVLSSAATAANEAAAVANAATAEKAEEKYITLYRGVSEIADPQKMYTAAQSGYAVPTAFLEKIPGKQPTTNPNSHVFNSKYSVFSSWTLQENVAMKFATNEGKNNGVILTIRVKGSEMIEADASKEYFPDDFEVLLFGLRKASPRNVTKTMYKK